MVNIKIPFTFDVIQGDPMGLSQYDSHITRRLSAMKGMYLDEHAFAALAATSDPLLYEFYEISRPAVTGELLHGLSIVHPGKVGDEYYMTKGHFHTILETAEFYYCLRGQGVMVMETPEGVWAVESLQPNRALYVPPRWAHRSVNTGSGQDLVFLFVYPGNAGHDYGSIEVQGFRKLVVERNGKPEIIDNPRWLSPKDRS